MNKARIDGAIPVTSHPRTLFEQRWGALQKKLDVSANSRWLEKDALEETASEQRPPGYMPRALGRAELPLRLGPGSGPPVLVTARLAASLGFREICCSVASVES